MKDLLSRIVALRERPWAVYGVFVALLAIYSVFALLCREGSTDVFVRYAPMAEAFAEGRWTEAFHPRFGVSFQVISGFFVWVTGGLLDGWDACICASVLAYACTFRPLWKLLRRVFDEPTAWFGVLLLAISPQVLRWVSSGMRESYRMLGLVLLVEAIFACRDGEKRASLIGGAIGALVLCTIRVDSIAAALFLVFVFCCVDRFTRTSWILCAVTFVCLQPTSFLVWKWTGWWVPAIQYIGILEKIAG